MTITDATNIQTVWPLTPSQTQNSVSPNTCDEKKRDWVKIALIVAGVALILSGVGSGIGLGIIAFQGTVAFFGTTIVSFTLQPFLQGLALFVSGLVSGLACLYFSKR